MSIRTVPAFLSLCLVAALAAPAEAQAPAAPALMGPANGASVEVPFRISWSATVDPTVVNGGYNWQVSRSSSFSPLLMADSTRPSITEDTISGLVNGTYFWRVQAVNPGGASAWSQPRSFVVVGAGPGTPGTPVLAPTRGYSTFHPWESVHFDWTAVPDAVTYRLEVSNDPDFSLGSPATDGIVTFWNDNIPTNSDGYVHTMVGTWYARVFAVDADNPQEGIRSLPSNVIQFTCFYNNPIGPPPQLLSPIDNPTLTLPVTLSWAHVPNPQAMGYVLEVANDPGFSDIEFFYNQYTEPTTEMLSLTSGPKFWRVLSQQGLSSPTTNANTDWSATGRFTISTAPARPVSFSLLGGAETFAFSGAERRLGLQLTAAVPSGGGAISLASSHPALAPVPATFSMLGGHAYAELPIRFGQVTSPTVITLTATLNGVSASSQFTLQPPTLNNEFLQPTVRATGGATMSGWVNLEGGGLAGPSGFVVNLSSSSPAATLPATVTIPAGVNGTGFQFQTRPVASTTVVTLTASAGAVTTSWEITLTPSPEPGELIVRPMATTSGSQGIVIGPEGAGQDQLVQVASSDPTVASVPSSATISAGSGVGFFDITTARVTEPRHVTISVTGGGTTLSHPLTLYPSLPALTAMTVTPSSVAGGGSATGTVTLGAPSPPIGVHVNLGSSQTTVSVPRSVFIAGGASSASFTIVTGPSSFTNTVQISAAMDGVFVSGSITVTPQAQTATLSSIAVSPTSVTGGASATGTATLSAAAPSGGAVVSLSDSSTATSVPASVTVPAGATSASFTVSTSSVSATTSSTITGSFGGTSRSVALTVNPASSTPTAPSLLSPANRATVAQPIAFDWTDVANAATYTIQIDSSSTFTTPLTYTATVNVSQATVTGLPAQQLFWRVRGVNSTGAAGPFSSSRRFTAQTAPSAAALSSLAISPTSVVGGSGATGTVTLTSAAATGGVSVNLSSSNAAVAAVPVSVTVAAGATTATFAIGTGSVAASTSVTVTATQGTTTRTATLTVTPVPPPSSLSAVSTSPSSVTGGTSSTGTVTLTSAAPGGGLLVNLSSSNPATASVPASVTVATGATTVQFPVATSPVSSSTAVTITAAVGGVTRTATLAVNPQTTGGALAAPSLLSPANDARFSPGQTITFDWSDVAGASSYTIQIDNSETFSAPFTAEQTTSVSRFTTSTLPITRLWWRVRANDGSGAPGAWSSVRRVEVKD
jgi:hypothetical protein